MPSSSRDSRPQLPPTYSSATLSRSSETSLNSDSSSHSSSDSHVSSPGTSSSLWQQSPVSDLHPDLSAVIGAGGVRIPFTPAERTRFEKAWQRKWSSNPYRYITSGHPEAPRQRDQAFDASALFTSTMSQLDILLPGLSSQNLLSGTTTRRPITVRLPLFPDMSPICLRQSAKSTQPFVRNYMEAEKLFEGFVSLKHSKDAVVRALLEVMESIVQRILLEGFVILEEWWHPRAKLAQFVVLA